MDLAECHCFIRHRRTEIHNDASQEYAYFFSIPYLITFISELLCLCLCLDSSYCCRKYCSITSKSAGLIFGGNCSSPNPDLPYAAYSKLYDGLTQCKYHSFFAHLSKLDSD